MSDILSRYGIKEVADVTFYKIKDNGTRDIPVLYLDSLKVSTIEQTAEVADAKGGKGNPALISWDYGREITVTLEDALFSPKSLAVAFGTGNVGTEGSFIQTREYTVPEKDEKDQPVENQAVSVILAALKWTVGGKQYSFKSNAGPEGKVYPTITNAVTGEAVKVDSEATTVTPGKYYVSGEVLVDGKSLTAQTIEISAETFPGTYYVTGDTYARSEATGQDELFQFIIPKAKVQSENTLTLEAEGDPTVFNMNLKVLKPKSGPMMKLVKYDFEQAKG